MFRRPATAAGGSLLATELLRDGGAVYNPGGGTHHGMADRAAGFCYLNDPVLAIKAFLAQGLTRIAYVDIDAHHCDGVAAAFHGEPRVLMISTHEARRWPFTGALDDRAGGQAINLPLPRETNDSGFAMALHEVILPAVQAMRPQAIVLQCGADAVTEDPLSRLALSNNAHWAALAALRPIAPACSCWAAAATTRGRSPASGPASGPRWPIRHPRPPAGTRPRRPRRALMVAPPAPPPTISSTRSAMPRATGAIARRSARAIRTLGAREAAWV